MFQYLRILMVIVAGFLSTPALAEATTTTVMTTGVVAIPLMGIVECDNFLAKYKACTSNLSPEIKTVLETAIQSTVEGWQQMLKDVPRDVIVKSCQTTHESMKTTMASYNCSW
jgi:hypothetical protein